MANRKHFISAADAARQRARTKANKIKSITKALTTAKGGAIERLNARLQVWKNK